MDTFRIEKLEGQYEDFLKDESKKTGTAVSISFPKDTQEVVDTLEHLAQEDIGVTIQGARTGITAGAVPNGGHILNLSRMDRVTGMEYACDHGDNGEGRFFLKLQPGVILSRLKDILEKKEFDMQEWSPASMEAYEVFKKSRKYFFPTDPTETSASLGGMAACNSSGARSFLYGPVRNHITAIEVVLADGALLKLARGKDGAHAGIFSIKTEAGRVIEGRLPDYTMPDVKNASGYYSGSEIDLIDLFIGSEGTLGVITELTLELMPKPDFIWGMTTFFDNERKALDYVVKIRQDGYENRPAAIEFFNHDTLELLRNFRASNPSFSNMPEIPEAADTAIYLEFHGETEDEVYEAAEAATELIAECAGDEDNTWLAPNKAELEKLHIFRHAAPEAVNLVIGERKKVHPGLTKLGTDMAVPDTSLTEVMEMYRRDLSETGLESVIFGHIGNNHVHVNILPRTMEEYELGLKLYHKWADRVISLGGTISAEHGVGKLKTALLKQMYGEEGIGQMRSVKKIFDPQGRLNPGNLFL